MNRSRSPHRRLRGPSGQLFVLTLLSGTLACEGGGPSGPGPNPPGLSAVSLVPVVEGLASPVALTTPPGDDRLFIVEQPGRIRVVRSGELLPTPFLDLSGSVVGGGERGLLGLAFHPDYPDPGYLYVSYTGAGGRSILERYAVSDDPDRADPSSASLLLAIAQPFPNHNGGQVSFGPDGYLYLAIGDGGSGGDPLGHGQDTFTLLGKLLRMDVDGGVPYAIPPDNPFAGSGGGRPEIWAWGLRNPWRFWHDPEDGLLYLADVGQSAREEVNVVPSEEPGVNYGWSRMEGDLCFGATSCDQSGLTLPALAYPHGSGAGRGCSVTGGVVPRGSSLPDLDGWYLYADFCGGWIRALRFENGSVREDMELLPGRIGGITSFGVDGAGEVYVLIQDGRVLRLESAPPTGGSS